MIAHLWWQIGCIDPVTPGGPADSDTPTGYSGDTGDSQDPGPGCGEQEDVWTKLASWDDNSPQGGISANYFFGYAVGPFVHVLHWDDGNVSDATQVANRGPVWEVDLGEQDVCPVSLVAQGTWDIISADERVDLSVPFDWRVEDQDPAQNIGAVGVAASLAFEAVGLDPRHKGSTLRLAVNVHTDGLLDLVIVEAWPLDKLTTRECERARLPGETQGCQDIVQEDVK